MRTYLKKFCVWFAQVAGISAVVLFAVCPVSCRMTEEGLKILTGDYTSPVIESYTVPDSSSVSIVFSEPVKIRGAVITPVTDASSAGDDNSAVKETVAPSLEAASGLNGAIPAAVSYDDVQKIITLTASSEFSTGAPYELYGKAEDQAGNTVTFCLPFTGFNNRVPRIIITEIHPGLVSGSDRCEFVELYALTSGNLAGLKVASASDGEDKGFALPPVEVRSGEIIVLHMRKRGENCINETGSNLSLAEGSEKKNYVSDTARDLWADNEKACLNDREDVIVLENLFSGKLVDAVPYSQGDTAVWKNDVVKKMAESAVEAGIWNSSEPSAAVSTDSMTSTKTLARKQCKALYDAVRNGILAEGVIPQKAGDWYLAGSKYVSPGAVQ
jgi:hypothetical protein